MRSIIKASLVAAMIATAACGGAPQEEFTRADAEAIRKELDDFVSLFDSKKTESIVTKYAENSVFMPPNAPLLRGREPLNSFFNDLFTRGATDLAMNPDTVVGHGPLAYMPGTYSLKYVGTGKPEIRDRGKFLLVLRKTAGAWKTEYTIWSSDLPKPAGS